MLKAHFVMSLNNSTLLNNRINKDITNNGSNANDKAEQLSTFFSLKKSLKRDYFYIKKSFNLL